MNPDDSMHRHLHEPIRQELDAPHSRIAALVFNLLDPIPYGFFVAALIFDAIYVNHVDVLWLKSAAWLIALGLVFAIVPRLINLARVWFTGGTPRAASGVAAFWLNAGAIVAAIVNAFVHSRDAYGVMPEGLWLSILTVALLLIAKVASTLQPSTMRALS
jgi:uncharacterized membrane protein